MNRRKSMKRLLHILFFAAFLLTPLLCHGQTAQRVYSGTGAPTKTCNPGPPVTDVWFRIDTAAWYYCSATNTWTAMSGGGGTPGGSNTQLQRNNSGSFGGISGV